MCVNGLIIQDVRGLIAQFRGIHEIVERIKDNLKVSYSISSNSSVAYILPEYNAVLKTLIEEYRNACEQFIRITLDTGAKTYLRGIYSSVKDTTTLVAATEILLQLSIESKKAIAFLESISTLKIPQE